MTSVLAALGLAVAGFVTTTAGAVVAAAGAPEIAPWAQVGGTATAVGALAYVAKLLADGRLVAQPVAELLRRADERDREQERRNLDRERRLEDLTADVRADAEALRSLLLRREHRDVP